MWSLSAIKSELEGLESVYDGLGAYQVGDDQNMGEDEIEALLR